MDRSLIKRESRPILHCLALVNFGDVPADID